MPERITFLPAGRRLFLTLLIAAAATIGYAGPASAHAALSGSDPQDGATVTAPPPSVTLSFNEEIVDYAQSISVTGPDTTSYQIGDPIIDGKNLTSRVAPLGTTGAYTLAFRVVSTDGHPITGQISFVYAPAAPPTPPSSGAPPPTPPSSTAATSKTRSSTSLSTRPVTTAEDPTNTGSSPASVPASSRPSITPSTTSVSSNSSAAIPAAEPAGTTSDAGGNRGRIAVVVVVALLLGSAATVLIRRRPRR